MYHIHIKHVLPEFSDSHDLSNYVLEIIHRKKQGFNFYPKKTRHIVSTMYCVLIFFPLVQTPPKMINNIGNLTAIILNLPIFFQFFRPSFQSFLQKILRFVPSRGGWGKEALGLFWTFDYFFFAVFWIIFQYLVKLIKKVPVLSTIMLNIVQKWT